MKPIIDRIAPLFLRIAFLAALPIPTLAADAQGWAAPEPWFAYGIVIFVLAGSLATLLMVRKALTVSTWSFSDALSEESEVTGKEADANGHSTIKLDTSGKPIMITEMRASSSRMIALMGTIVILLMFLGFGAFALYSFANTGTMPESIDKIVNFLLSGLTFFAPYAVNKFSRLFERFAPRKA